MAAPLAALLVAALTLAGDPTLARIVELKLLDYYDHLVKTIQGFHSEV